MKIKRLLLTSAGLLALTFGASWVLAQGHPGGPPDHPSSFPGHGPGKHGMMLGRHLNDLNLSETQIQQLHQTMQEHHAAQEELQQLRRSLHELSLSDTYSDVEADNISRQIGDLTATIANDSARAIQEFYQSLYAEQKTKVAEMSAKPRW